MLLEGVKCPACNENCKLAFDIADAETTNWIFCACGSIFHQRALDKAYFNAEYLSKYKEWKGIEHRYEYLERIYLPLVEELTYGRRFLDVGMGCDYHVKNLEDRGWITTGIDLIPNDQITGDFETYDFKKEKFDFLLMAQVIESFKDPMKALYKAKELLLPQGILMLTGADAELIYKIGMWHFGNWNSKEKWLIFSEKQMKRVLDLLGFNVIVSHKNTEHRFMAWNTFHILAQKRPE